MQNNSHRVSKQPCALRMPSHENIHLDAPSHCCRSEWLISKTLGVSPTCPLKGFYPTYKLFTRVQDLILKTNFLRNSVLLVGYTKPGPSPTNTHRKPLSDGCAQARGWGMLWKVLQEEHPHSSQQSSGPRPHLRPTFRGPSHSL